MRRDSLRSLALILVLLLGAGASLRAWRARTSTAARPQASPQGFYSVHVDLAGWYEATPYEKVVAGPYDLRFDALPSSLPLQIGPWHGVELGPSAEIESFFAHPDLIVRREYSGPSGRVIWLTIIGSRGPKSFSIFEHTPEICYPSSGWSALTEDAVAVNLKYGAMNVRRGIYEHGRERQVVYSWYQWDDPARDAAKGVTSWRLATDARDGLEEAQGHLHDFLGLLFHEVFPWHRF